MKIFLDGSLVDIAPLFRFIDYDVLTVADEGLAQNNYEENIEFAKNGDYIFITENADAIKIAKSKGIRYIFLDSVMKANTIKSELEKNDAKTLEKKSDLKYIHTYENKITMSESGPQSVSSDVEMTLKSTIESEPEKLDNISEIIKNETKIHDLTAQKEDTVVQNLPLDNNTVTNISSVAENEYDKNYNEGVESAKTYTNLKISELEKLISNIEKDDRVAIRLRIKKEVVESILNVKSGF